MIGIRPLQPQGNNSTMFTKCCGCAICDDERLCPQCKQEVIGADVNNSFVRGRIRWHDATKHWKRGAQEASKP